MKSIELLLGRIDLSLIIRKNVTWQYVLLYLVYMLNDSFLYKNYISRYNLVIFVILVFLTIIVKRKCPLFIWGFLAFSLASVVIVRILQGGVGLDAWLRWAVPILLVYYAFSIDKDQFLHRWVKLVVVMSVISLIFWLGCQIDADLIRKLLPTHYSVGQSVLYWTSSTSAVYQAEYGDGLLLYAVRNFELDRNNGVFSEPGLHQMVLNATLFMLLFMKDRLEITSKQQMKYSVVLLITLITCKSTSGYLSFVVIIMMFVMQKNRAEAQNKYRIISVALIGVAVLLVEYSVNGTNSLLYTQLLNKIFSNGTITISADSGMWRMMTISTAWSSMLRNPLGIGYDNASVLLVSGSSGAQIFLMGAALGIIPFLVFQAWTWYPVLKSRLINILGKIAFMFMFYNSMLAQSKEFYSVFLIFTIYCFFKKQSQSYSGEMGILNVD